MELSNIILVSALAIISVLLGALNPKRTDLSEFEISRRLSLNDRRTKSLMDREKLIVVAVTIKQILTLILIVTISFIIFSSYASALGLIISSLLALSIYFLSKIPLMIKLSNNIFKYFEQPSMQFLKRQPLFSKIKVKFDNPQVSSIEGLQFLISNIEEGLLSDEQRKLIVSGLEFNNRQVKEVMTPIKEAISVDRSEFLGPLVLDELHKSGHNYLPVIDKTSDKIVGILSLKKLLSLDIKRSTTAEKAMDKQVYYINHKSTLKDVIIAMLKNDSYLSIVTKQNKNIGLVTIRDVLENLFDQELI